MFGPWAGHALHKGRVSCPDGTSSDMDERFYGLGKLERMPPELGP